MLGIIVAVVGCYLLGSIPFGYIVGKLVKGIDVREHGSGNVGATNVLRVVGKRWGFFVLFLDGLKGAIAVIVLSQFLGVLAMPLLYKKLVCSIIAVCGHNWTIFLKFKGGKGVATTSGAMLAVFPPAYGCTFAVFAVVVWLTKYVSLGSIMGAVFFPVFVWLFYADDPGFVGGLVFSLFLVVFIVWRHFPNIQRLMAGTENKTYFKKKPEQVG